MKMTIDLPFLDALHLSTVILFEAKDHIKGYKLFKQSNPELAEIYREDAMREFKIYKKIKEVL